MKPALALILLLVLVLPVTARARIPLESEGNPGAVSDQALARRVEDVLARAEKRVREVFGIRIAIKAVLGPSGEDYDFRLSAAGRGGDAGGDGLLLINSRLVAAREVKDLEIGAARALYQAVWPKFRKSSLPAPLLIQRLYDEGMTAYAAELLFPGAAKWKYAGLFGSEAADDYERYLAGEKTLAREAQEAVSAGSATSFFERLFPGPREASHSAAGGLLAYRIMKTFEREMDPKMIQLMDLAEFRKRLPAGLAVLQQGFGRSR